MSRYNRNEAFRYEFVPAIYCFFKSRNGINEMLDGEIMDISPCGLKLKTPTDIPLAEMLYIEFGIITPISVRGDIRWKRNYGSYFIYGIHLKNDSDLQKQITYELKQYVKRKLIH